MVNSFFEVQNLLRPFVSERGELYYLCAKAVIEDADKRHPDDTASESDVKRCIAKTVKRYNAEHPGTAGENEECNPGRILAYFREHGWIGKREIKDMDNDTAPVTENLRQIVAGMEDLLTPNDIPEAADALLGLSELICTESWFRRRNPYKFILLEMEKHVNTLSRQGVRISDEFKTQMRRLNFNSLTEMENYTLADDGRNTALKEYFDFFKNGEINAYLTNTVVALENIVYSDAGKELLADTARDALRSGAYGSLAEAERGVTVRFENIKEFLDISYSERLRQIDEMFSEYQRRYTVRLQTLSAGGKTHEALVNETLRALAEADEETKGKMLEMLCAGSNVTNFRNLQTPQLEIKKLSKRKRQGGFMTVRTLTDAEIKEAREKLEKFKSDPYSAADINKWVKAKMTGRKKLTAEGGFFECPRDLLRIHAASVYSDAGRLEYSVLPISGHDENKYGTIKKTEIRKFERLEGE